MIAAGCLSFVTVGYSYEAAQNTDWSIQASILPQRAVNSPLEGDVISNGHCMVSLLT